MSKILNGKVNITAKNMTNHKTSQLIKNIMMHYIYDCKTNFQVQINMKNCFVMNKTTINYKIHIFLQNFKSNNLKLYCLINKITKNQFKSKIY